MKNKTLEAILIVLIFLDIAGCLIGIFLLCSFDTRALSEISELSAAMGSMVESVKGFGVAAILTCGFLSVFFFYCLYRALVNGDELEERLQEIERKTSQMQTSDLHSILDQLKNDPTISKGIFVPKGRKCMYCGKILSPDNTDIICDNCKRFLNQ